MPKPRAGEWEPNKDQLLALKRHGTLSGRYLAHALRRYNDERQEEMVTIKDLLVMIVENKFDHNTTDIYLLYAMNFLQASLGAARILQAFLESPNDWNERWPQEAGCKRPSDTVYYKLLCNVREGLTLEQPHGFGLPEEISSRRTTHSLSRPRRASTWHHMTPSMKLSERGWKPMMCFMNRCTAGTIYNPRLSPGRMTSHHGTKSYTQR